MRVPVGLSGLGEHHVDVALLVLRFGLLPKLDSRQALRVRFVIRRHWIQSYKFSKCGYGFPVEESAFVFNSKLLTTNELQLSNGGQVPDWLLGENRCYIERGNSSTYLCISQHSSCIDSIYTYELGYRCACSTGYYKGNLHLPNGCQDINECERPEEYHCYGRCLNLPGNFSCTCPSGKEGDPRTQGGCRKRSKQFPIWLGILIDFRLKVAGESAGALAYLHSDASPSILHGDIKSSNILLDEGNAPKVSDFGASLFNIEERVTREQAQGTHGYIDPEYMQTCQMTDKSDVYSFAVMLLEIFTRKKAIITDESGPITLASAFRSRVEANTFRELFDLEIRDGLNDENVEELEKMLARCLRQRGQDRPSMKEESAFIERLRESFKPSVPSMSAHQLNPSSSFYSDGSAYYRRTVSRAGFNIHSGR